MNTVNIHHLNYVAILRNMMKSCAVLLGTLIVHLSSSEEERRRRRVSMLQ